MKVHSVPGTIIIVKLHISGDSSVPTRVPFRIKFKLVISGVNSLAIVERGQGYKERAYVSIMNAFAVQNPHHSFIKNITPEKQYMFINLRRCGQNHSMKKHEKAPG